MLCRQVRTPTPITLPTTRYQPCSRGHMTNAPTRALRLTVYRINEQGCGRSRERERGRESSYWEGGQLPGPCSFWSQTQLKWDIYIDFLRRKRDALSRIVWQLVKCLIFGHLNAECTEGKTKRFASMDITGFLASLIRGNKCRTLKVTAVWWQTNRDKWRCIEQWLCGNALDAQFNVIIPDLGWKINALVQTLLKMNCNYTGCLIYKSNVLGGISW